MSGTNDVLGNIGNIIWHEVSKSLSAKCKPCPYCGNKIVYVGRLGACYAALCANYHCPNAHIWAFDTPEKAIEAWNRRTKDE